MNLESNISKSGQSIKISNNQLIIPNEPIIPYIEGDGVGPEISKSMISIINAAVKSCYGNQKKIHWFEIYAGEKANKIYKEEVWLPNETVDAINEYKIAIKGPLTTPVGGGQRSLNVRLRQILDLYVCQRPVSWFKGVPSPITEPEKIDMVIFRENSEDVYSGIEWPFDSDEQKKLMSFLQKEMKVTSILNPEECGLGLKNVSRTGSKRLIRSAIEYAINNDRSSVTLVHKGNIMKFTEGAFLNWGFDLAKEEFGATYDEVNKIYKIKNPNTNNDIIVKDCICDAFFQNILLKPEQYDVIATLNLNGDYLSDALAACVGGIGISPGANINYKTGTAVFEATHGTAPDIAGKNIANPSSLVLSGAMLLEYIGWKEAGSLIVSSIGKTIKNKTVTADFAYQMENAELLSCSEFTKAVIENF